MVRLRARRRQRATRSPSPGTLFPRSRIEAPRNPRASSCSGRSYALAGPSLDDVLWGEAKRGRHPRKPSLSRRRTFFAEPGTTTKRSFSSSTEKKSMESFPTLLRPSEAFSRCHRGPSCRLDLTSLLPAANQPSAPLRESLRRRVGASE